MIEGKITVGEKQISVGLVGLSDSASLEDLAVALERIYPRQSPEQIRSALSRLPLVLSRSATQDQARKLKQFLEPKGAILKFTVSSASTQTQAQTQAPTPPRPISPTRKGTVTTPSESPPVSPGMPGGLERRAKPRVHPGIEVHPMGIGEILDRSFRLLRKHFLLFFGILLIPQGTFLLITKVVQITLGGDIGQATSMAAGFGISFILALLVMMILQFWAQGALIHAVSETYLGHNTSLLTSFGAMRSRLGRLLGTMILMGFLLGLVVVAIVFIGGMLTALLGSGTAGNWSGVIGVIVVGIVGAVVFFHLLLSWLLVDKVVVLEDRGWVKALSRSRDLMKVRTEPGFWKRPKNKAGLILLLGFLIAIGIHTLFQLPGALAQLVMPSSLVGTTVQEILNVLASSLAAVYTAIAMILYYYDIRLRSEGFDLKMMAEHL